MEVTDPHGERTLRSGHARADFPALAAFGLETRVRDGGRIVEELLVDVRGLERLERKRRLSPGRSKRYCDASNRSGPRGPGPDRRHPHRLTSSRAPRGVPPLPRRHQRLCLGGERSGLPPTPRDVRARPGPAGGQHGTGVGGTDRHRGSRAPCRGGAIPSAGTHLLAPDASDWLEAGATISRLGGTAVTKTRSFWNDALLAAQGARLDVILRDAQPLRLSSTGALHCRANRRAFSVSARPPSAAPGATNYSPDANISPPLPSGRGLEGSRVRR
jgi:hypothetical protein